MSTSRATGFAKQALRKRESEEGGTVPPSLRLLGPELEEQSLLDDNELVVLVFV
jgi:hypothetical protein